MVDRIKYEWYYSQADRWIRHDLTEDNMILERFPKLNKKVIDKQNNT